MNGKSSNRLNYIGLKQCKNFILRDLKTSSTPFKDKRKILISKLSLLHKSIQIGGEM